jgi:anti-anti-sigma factor
MTVSPFSNSAPPSSSTLHRAGWNEIAIPYELVRGNEDRVQAELLPHVRQGSVALDLSQVERIDAAGIASLITLYCSAIEAGNEFYVVDPSARVLELLHLVGLDGILVSGNDVSNSGSQLAGDIQAQFSRSAA